LIARKEAPSGASNILHQSEPGGAAFKSLEDIWTDTTSVPFEADRRGRARAKLASNSCAAGRHRRFINRGKASPMQMSKTIAALIGPTLMALGFALLVNLGSFPAIIESVSRDPALIFLSGVLLFVAGVAIVRVHNRWTSDWSVLVTALGWLAVLGGIGRMLFPIQLASMTEGLSRSSGLFLASAGVLLVVGAFLSFKAYAHD
jgi:uncharacterized protein YjeT (DUF2065 family)